MSDTIEFDSSDGRMQCYRTLDSEGSFDGRDSNSSGNRSHGKESRNSDGRNSKGSDGKKGSIGMSTLESIGSNGKKESVGTSTLESNISSGTVGSSGLLIKTPANRTRTLEDDHNSFLLLGGLQMLLGVLMAVFGVLALAHNAALSAVGAGLWGGAVAMVTGVFGFLTGLRTSHLAVTAFLALNLVSLAVSNLVVVLAVTGLVRDGNAQENQPDPDWHTLFSNAGLLVVTAAQCVAILVSGYRCYRHVCPCRPRHRTLGGQHRTSTTGTPEPAWAASSKDQLIANWLVQHPGRPNNILLVPQAAIHGHFSPIYTLPSPPISSMGYPSMCRHYQPMKRRYEGQRPRRLRGDPVVSRLSNERRERRKRQAKKQITEEDVAKTYTGLDRRVAEDFIESAMTPTTWP